MPDRERGSRPTTERKKKPAAKTAAKRGRAKATPAARRKAETATVQAKAAGATGRNGSDAQRAMRDNAIIARLATGDTQKEVARLFDIAERTVREIAKRKKRPTIFDAVPMEIAEGYARQLEVLLSDFEALAYAHANDNPNASVAALKGRLTTIQQLMELAHYAGKLPSNLGLFRAETVLRSMAADMGKALARVKAGEITLEEADDLFGQIARENELHDPRRALPPPA